jgi:hypothetical protein
MDQIRQLVELPLRYLQLFKSSGIKPPRPSVLVFRETVVEVPVRFIHCKYRDYCSKA